jgi:hypothetical protein
VRIEGAKKGEVLGRGKLSKSTIDEKLRISISGPQKGTPGLPQKELKRLPRTPKEARKEPHGPTRMDAREFSEFGLEVYSA